jgi:LPS-assembly protein
VTSFAALSAAALLAGLTASPLGARPAPTGDVTFEAGQTVWNAETGTYDLSGGVVVRRGAVLLRARRAILDPAHDEVQATGDVLLVDAARVLHADGIHAVIDGPFEASGVIAFLKDQPLELARATSLEEARRGRNRVTFSADRVEGDAEGRLALRGARFTLCDCGEGKAPTWELRSGRARVADDRAALTWPTLYVTPRFLLVQHPVPVLILPWISLPLLDRQSGLLFTEFGTAPATGWYLAQPVYLTLGRSADLTATPEYFFGPGNGHQAGGSVKGPGARLELRWAPAERAEGLVRWHVVEDEDHERPDGGHTAGSGGAGLRLSLEGSHRQDLGPDTRLVGHLSLSQDPFMFRDFQGTALPGDAYYARSDALVSRRAADVVLEAGAAYYEPLVSIVGTARPGTFGWFGAQAPALQRWPSLGAALLPVALGPLELQGRAGISRFAPPVGHLGGLLPTDPGYWRAGTLRLLDGSDPLPREAVTRSEARLELSAPLLLWRALSFEPFVRGAALGYAFDADRPAAATAWGVAGVSTSAVLARRYGEAEHRLVPRLELLAGTAPWRANPGEPFPAYDLWDRIEAGRQVAIPGTTQETAVVQKLSAAPDGAYAQLRGSIESRLSAGKAGQLDAELGQDLDVRAGRLAESFASLSGSRGWFAADASARALLFGGRPALTSGWKASWLDAFTQLHAGASAHDPRGDQLRASLDSTGPGAVGAQGAGVDALFDLGSSGLPPGASATLGAHGALGGASLDYTVQLAARDTLGVQCHDRTVTRMAGQPVQQTAVLAWDSPCHCFVARVRASLDACGAPHVGFDIDLSKILQGASGGGG